MKDIDTAKSDIGSALDSAVLKIVRGDRISVQITSQYPEQLAFLNLNTASLSGGGQSLTAGHLVDENGEIELPLLGKIKLANLTRQQAVEEIKKRVEVYFKDPVVYVNLHGRVFFLHASGGSVIPIENQRLTILEALAQSGGIGFTEQRDKVWLIRERGNTRKIVQLDLTQKSILNSEYFYLQNNDLIYIQPDKTAAFLAANSPMRSLFGVSVGLLATVTALFKLAF